MKAVIDGSLGREKLFIVQPGILIGDAKAKKLTKASIGKRHFGHVG